MRDATRITLSAGAIVATAILCLSTGAAVLSPDAVLHALLHYTGSTSDLIVIWLRMPRVILGILVGASLGMAGTILQGLTRNPLADPAILGMNGGSALALLSWLTLLPRAPLWAQSFVSLAGGFAAILLVLASSRLLARGEATETMVVIGATVSAALASLTTAWILLTGQGLQRLQFWLVGSLSARDWRTVGAVLPFLLVGLAAGLPLGRPLNALTLGEQTSQTIGLSLQRTRLWGIMAALLLCAGSVAAAGPIGFVGLLIPHALRPLVGYDYRRLLSASLVAGSIFLPLCDLAARSALVPFYGELPVGLLTAVLGAPALLLVLHRKALHAS